MNKYLIEILKIQNSVILPGLGALMVPSQKTGKIVFNQHLKFNDGSLARFIAEKEGIDAQEAQNKVAKFIREIEAELGKGNSYDMFEFGRFVKNKDGDVNFEMTAESIGDSSEEEVTPPVEVKKKAIVSPGDILREDKKVEEEASKSTSSKSTDDSQKKADKKEKKAAEKEAEELKKKAEKEKIEAEEKEKKALKEAEEKAKVAADKAASEAKKELEKKEEKIIPPVIASAKTDVKASEDKQSKNKFTPAEEAQRAADTVKETAATAAVKVNASISDIGDGVKDTKKAFDKKDSSKSSSKKESTKVVIEKEKKKKSKLPWIILLLVLIGLAVAGYLFKSEIMEFLNMGEEHSEVDGDHENDGTNGDDDGTIDGSDELDANDESLNSGLDSLGNSDEAVEETIEEAVEEVPEKVVEETKTKPIVNSSSSGNYHIIGNSFNEKSNAESYASSMQSKGFPAKILGRFDGLYMVSVKSYDSRSAAVSGIGAVSADAWVFKWPK